MKNHYKALGMFVLLSALAAGCATSKKGNEGQMNLFPVADHEAKWIRAGEPIEFEGEAWYPQDGIETLLDSEVILLGESRGIQFFADKIDVRPFQRIYTKFGKNKFRYYMRKE